MERKPTFKSHPLHSFFFASSVSLCPFNRGFEKVSQGSKIRRYSGFGIGHLVEKNRKKWISQLTLTVLSNHIQMQYAESGFNTTKY
jgi:hypothetical protein